MSRVNTIGADLAERGLVRAATDVTGFGLLGHLASMCRASGVSAEIFAHDVPVISDEIFELIEHDCVPGGTKKISKTASATDGVEKDAEVLGACCSPTPRPAADCCSAFRRGDWRKCVGF